MKLLDGLRNFVSGLGTERAKGYHTEAFWHQLSQPELEALFFGDWLARKIVEIIPADETREWRVWNSEDDTANLLYEAEKALQIRSKVREARTWARLYGGGAILIGDGAPDPGEPLDVERIKKGGIRYLHVLTRHEMSREGLLSTDIEDPDFGKPVHYRVTVSGATSTPPIHRSRFVLFDGLAAPLLWRQQNDGWGRPVLEVVRDAIMQAGSTMGNVSELTHEAKVDVIKVPELAGYLADAEAERRLQDRFMLAAQMKSVVKTLMLGGNEEFEQKQINFSQLPELIRTFLAVAAAAADIPATRLLGQSPDGMNATGESDIRNYYDKIRAAQSTDLADDLRVLDQALFQHALGRQPEDTTYEWVPLWQQTPKEKAEVAKINAETTKIYVDGGIFHPEVMARAARDQIINDDVYPSFETHYEDVENDPAFQFEEPEREPAEGAASESGERDLAETE